MGEVEGNRNPGPCKRSSPDKGAFAPGGWRVKQSHTLSIEHGRREDDSTHALNLHQVLQGFQRKD